MNKRVLIVDNYDSFSYNLYQYFGMAADEVIVVKDDEYGAEELLSKFSPTHIVLSPGPGRPSEAGICEEAAKHFAGKVPLLGVCLGHQAIAEAYGGEIVHAKKLMHGKADMIEVDPSCPIFKGLERRQKVARYHSLAADRLPPSLSVAAYASDGEIMAIKHNDFDIYGVQFHPESILTECGRQIIHNFLEL